MIDKTQEIKAFLKKHYSPGTVENSIDELKLPTSALREYLFQVFPRDCIDDYDLAEILKQLGYEPHKIGSLQFVWCLIENETEK